jgi:hypothetical protein
MKYITLAAISSILLSSCVCTTGKHDNMSGQNEDRLDKLRKAVDSGNIAYGLTKPNEIKAILGEPQTEEKKEDGGMIGLDIGYPDVIALFGKSKKDKDASFKLMGLEIEGEEVDIGGVLKGQRQIVVRNIDDLHEMELMNVNLRHLDLSGEGDYLKGEDFDSLTQWPGPDKLPPGFNPRKLLEEGKNPGLGIRALHEEGINGEGVGIAILDQPLLLGHEEYTSRLIRYDSTRASKWLTPQMHGSPIVGIAVGKRCGVAPGAFVFYYAATTTAEHEDQADCIDEIINYNETAGESERIRVISISASPEDAADNDAYMKAHKRALDTGILMVTCSGKFLRYGTLTLIEGEDPDKPESYKPGRYAHRNSILLIPIANKTIASHRGTNVYQYEREGGMSWAAPYIAGLAALAFQVNPDLKPQAIVDQLVKTATHTKAGPVVNPRRFIESVKRLNKK